MVCSPVQVYPIIARARFISCPLRALVVVLAVLSTTSPSLAAPPTNSNVSPKQAREAVLRRLTQAEFRNSVEELLHGQPLPDDLPFPPEPRVLGFANQATLQSPTADSTRATQTLAEFTARFIAKTWTTADPRISEEGLSRARLIRIMSELFRRPPNNQEIARYSAFHDQQKLDHGAIEGVYRTLIALLMSPKFWYRIEYGGTGKTPSMRPLLTDHELATRLSFLLWSQAPSWSLLQEIRTVRLQHDRSTLPPLAQNMFDDSLRVIKMLFHFHEQWLDLNTTTKAQVYAQHKVPPEIIDSFRRYLHSVIVEHSGTLEQLLAGPTGQFHNHKTARFFGIAPHLFPKAKDQISKACVASLKTHQGPSRLCTRGGNECAKGSQCLADLNVHWGKGPGLCVRLEPRSSQNTRRRRYLPPHEPTTSPHNDGDICAFFVLEPAGLVDLVNQKGDSLPSTINLKEARIPKACAKDLCLQQGSSYGGWAEINVENEGILSQPLVLINHAEANNPYLGMIRRGKLIRERLLCQEVQPPPPGVPPIPDHAGQKTPRQALEHHIRSGSCKRCHEKIDPLGSPFEVFDALGRYRDVYPSKLPLDTSGTITGTLDANGAVKNLKELMTRLSKSEQVRDCYVRQWFRFAFGRIENQGDEKTLNELRRKFRRSGYKIRALVLAITETEEFRTLPPEGDQIKSPVETNP